MEKYMKSNFCTLFDSYYLTRGITMYESLEKCCSNFHLYIFAFDDSSLDLLKKRNLKYATIISLLEFEDDKLLSVKQDRSIGEYCWTATGSTIKYCLDNFFLDSCTYLDADLYFFSNPLELLQEVSNGSTLIVSHRYTPEYDQSRSSGKYCVQFMTFHNNKNSLKVLNYWIESCIEWCYARAEDGKFGDQKYLDEWANRFDDIHELKHLGGGVAPWNVQQYDFCKENNVTSCVEISSQSNFDLVFFHFHALKFLKNNKVDLSSYKINNNVIEEIYKPYLKHLNKINYEFKNELELKTTFTKGHSIKYYIKRLLSDKTLLLRYFKTRIFRNSNIYDIKRIIGE
jgi:hypothetical protein